ncbi:hypothetical protein TNCV_1280811 [Trichonephila clavipes]|nr:hypothetical protein TNCV_1280811 [Trichonephila clavipes]
MVSLGDEVFYFCSLADFVRDVEALMELRASWTSHGPLHTNKLVNFTANLPPPKVAAPGRGPDCPPLVPALRRATLD